MKVRVDSKEPRWVATAFDKDFDVTVESLEVGDLWLEPPDRHLIIIERKTGLDLFQSIRDERLENQVAEAIAITPHVCVLITDTIHNVNGHAAVKDQFGIIHETGWGYSAVWGMLAQIQRMGAVVRFHEGALPDVCIRLTHLFAFDHREVRGRNYELREQPLDIRLLACLPGIGPERAQALLAEFGTVAASLEWLTAENPERGVAGIGPETRRKCADVLGGVLHVA